MKKKVSISIFVAFMAILFLMDSCMQFRMSTSEIDQYFKKREIQYRSENYNAGTRELHYVKTGLESGPVVFFF